MNRLFAAALCFALIGLVWSGAAMSARAAAPAVETVGVYSNVRISHGEDPHADGWEVELYREGGQLFGLFYSAQGLAGDTPRGRLQDLRYDAASGKLSFRAKLTVGREYSRDSGDDGRPSRDLFEFDGRLSAKALAGELIHRDGYRPGQPVERVEVKLSLDPRRTRDARERAPASRAKWAAEPLANGPQW